MMERRALPFSLCPRLELCRRSPAERLFGGRTSVCRARHVFSRVAEKEEEEEEEEKEEGEMER